MRPNDPTDMDATESNALNSDATAVSRRAALVPLALGVLATTPARAGVTAVATATATSVGKVALPDRYDEPLGIGLEGWPYPAPVHFYACTLAGQPLRMAYMDIPPTGPSRNRTVVLLHGKNFDSSYWAGPIKDLAQAGYRVIVPDQIGFNKSSKPDLTYTVDGLTETTLHLLGAQQIGRFSVIGHSTGGLIAVRLAATHPDKVDRLVLEDPLGLVAYRRYVPAQSIDTLTAAEHRRTVGNLRSFLRGFFPVLSPAAMEPFVEWRMRVALSGEYDRFCRASALTYDMIYREPIRDEIDDIVAPTLLMVGEKDTTSPLRNYAAPDVAAKIPGIPAAAAEAAKDLRKGTFTVIPNVGHVPHLEAPEQFRQAVLTFLVS